MALFNSYIEAIPNKEYQEKTRSLFMWIEAEFPDLKTEVKWRTPLFTSNGTFIIGITPTKNHLSINPESAGIEKFQKEIQRAGYKTKQMTFTIPYDDEIDYNLLRKIIEFNIEDKKNTDKFWR